MMRYYFLGICGVSMSALACFLKEKGNYVRGFDDSCDVKKELDERLIFVDHSLNEKEILRADVVVSSSALKEGHPVFDYVHSNRKKIISRGELLGELSQGFEKVIAVAGSHGKTTTTAMIYEILKAAGKNPTLHLGGFRQEDGKNFEVGGEEFFVTEACEYYDNFLHLHPYIAVVTNVEKEHMDYFKSFTNQKKSFEKFKSQARFVVDDSQKVCVRGIRHDKKGGLIFDLYRDNRKIMHLHLRICEEVNVENCIYAYLVAKKLRIDDCVIKLALEKFGGVKTRFERVRCGEFEDVICDYAHHPTEIRKAIDSAKKIFSDKRLVTIFQPHTYSRTKSLLGDFLDVFECVDVPLFFKTYSAREKESDGVSAEYFAKTLKVRNKNARYFENFEDLHSFLKELPKDEVVLLFLGAGDLPSILHKKQFIT